MKKIQIFMSAIVLISLFFAACKDDNALQAPTEDQLDFSISPGSDAYHWIIKNTSSVAGTVIWDLGNGEKPTEEEVIAFYPTKGSYTITLKLTNDAGSASKSIVHEQTVSKPAENLVKGGQFLDATDHAKWTEVKIADGADWVFSAGKATITASGWGNQLIYQAIEVEKDLTYTVDLLASSTSGVSDSWFEIYVDPTLPLETVDYKSGGMKRSINTWDGCGTAAFSDQISIMGCKAENNTGLFTAAASGTVYLVIKSGGADMKEGISITNVEFRLKVN